MKQKSSSKQYKKLSPLYLEQMVIHLKSEVVRYKTMVNKYERNYSVNKIRLLNDELKSLTTEKEENEIKLESYKTEIITLNESISKYRKIIDLNKERLSEFEQVISELFNQIKQFDTFKKTNQIHLDKLEKAQSELILENEKLHVEKAKALEENGKLEKVNQKNQDQLIRIQQEIEDKTVHFESETEKLKKCISSLHQNKNEVEQKYDQEINSLTKQITTLKNREEDVSISLKKEKEKVDFYAMKVVESEKEWKQKFKDQEKIIASLEETIREKESKLQSEKENFEKENNYLREELSSKEMAQQNNFNQFNKKIESLTNSIKDKDQAISKYKQQIETKEQFIEDKINSLMLELAEKKKQCQIEKREWKWKLDNVKTSATDKEKKLNNEVSLLKDEIIFYQKKKNENEERIQVQDEKLQHLKVLQNEKKETELAIVNYRALLEEKQEKCLTLEKELAQSEEEFSSYRQKTEEDGNLFKESYMKSNEKEELVLSLKLEKEQIKRYNEKLMKELEVAQKQINEMKTNDASKSWKRDLIEQLKLKNDREQELVGRLNELMKENESLKNLGSEKQDKIQYLLNELTNYGEEIHTNLSLIKKMEQKIIEFEQRIHEDS